MKRIKIRDRQLPVYSKGEESMNMITHIAGGGLAVLMAVLCVVKAVLGGDVFSILGCGIYGCSMILLYTMSSVYHGMRAGTGKKVMQVIDHCSIYFLIAGTYTAVMTSAMIPAYPVIGWGMMIFQWSLAILAATLTAIDLHKYRVLSMVCYIGMGWCILIALKPLMQVLAAPGFLLLLAGGIVYTIGAILYGIGTKCRYMHSVFHFFVLAGSILQALCILLYVL